jgi:phage tail-like protein
MAPTGKRTDPFVAFRFEVQIDGLGSAGFSDCSGLNYEVEAHEYVEGGLNDRVWRFATRGRQENLVLKRGIVDRELWDWFSSVLGGAPSRHSGAVVVKDHSGSTDVLKIAFRDAFPVKWRGPELSAAGSTVAMEMIELAHHGIERVR